MVITTALRNSVVITTALTNTYMVGTYSPGNEFVVYDINMHVFPTDPSPTTTHLMSRSVFAILILIYFLFSAQILCAVLYYTPIVPRMSKQQNLCFTDNSLS